MEKFFKPQEKKFNLAQPVNLLEKDGDPRKLSYIQWIVDEAREGWHKVKGEGGGFYSPSIFRLHKDEGLLEKTPEGKRKHMAPEHILTVMIGCTSLARMLADKVGINEQDLKEILLAAAVHDVNKDIEAKVTRLVLEDKKAGFGQAGYDLAGDVSIQKLRFARVPEPIIQLHKMVGHTSCPEIESLLQEKPISKKLVKALILHYVDDIVTNPNVIDPTITMNVQRIRENALDRRCNQNENNPTYKKFNEAWKHDPRNTTGETAFVMQRRVGHLVETKLAELLELEDPLTLPAHIYEQMQIDVQQHWDSRERREQ